MIAIEGKRFDVRYLNGQNKPMQNAKGDVPTFRMSVKSAELSGFSLTLQCDQEDENYKQDAQHFDQFCCYLASNYACKITHKPDEGDALLYSFAFPERIPGRDGEQYLHDIISYHTTGEPVARFGKNAHQPTADEMQSGESKNWRERIEDESAMEEKIFNALEERISKEYAYKDTPYAKTKAREYTKIVLGVLGIEKAR